MLAPLPIKYIDALTEIDPHISYNAEYFHRRDASLRVIHLSNTNVDTDQKLIFMPGWASTIFTWRYFLSRMTRFASVYYIETREKSSSILSDHAVFNIDAMTDDLTYYLHTYHGSSNYLLAGASTGATIIIEAWRQLHQKPLRIALILPNKKIPIPSYIWFLKLVPRRLLPYLKPAAMFFMTNFRLSPKEVDQHSGMFAAVEDGNLHKLRASGLVLAKYSLLLSAGLQIDRPTLIIGAEQDRLHNANDIIDIQRSIPGSSYINLNSFTAAHSSKAADLVGRWITQRYE